MAPPPPLASVSSRNTATPLTCQEEHHLTRHGGLSSLRVLVTKLQHAPTGVSSRNTAMLLTWQNEHHLTRRGELARPDTTRGWLGKSMPAEATSAHHTGLQSGLEPFSDLMS